ncbi:alpha-glucan family phosphorylase [Dyadobacter tibetensis]|uniref:alpha-glucan family phosphorylase n=1 Tax=Dyadobacter tibetensis TaxID=1211851 RepID=UPI001E5C38B4|nr:alpha-glucan family phosphorylase [Dyadobacter tibetensis]
MRTQFEFPFHFPLDIEKKYKKAVAYFSMEFAIDQALKIYSGGLGFLAGSHMRSAKSLNQHLVGIGMLWKYGYYDQGRNQDNSMVPIRHEKIYHFLQRTGVRFQVTIEDRGVWVEAYYLAPDVFGSAPVFLLTTDVEGNQEADRAITYQLYDYDTKKKVEQCMILGIGGAILLEKLKWKPQVYHFNEAHAISAAFYLYGQASTFTALKQQIVFTTHTPEEAGNEKHDINFLNHLGFFSGLPLEEVRNLSGNSGELFNHTLAALHLSRKANAVSKLHGEVAREMWKGHPGSCEIIHITNAQKKSFWVDEALELARVSRNIQGLRARKRALKVALFEMVADQCGKLLDPDVLTIVWARRFATYKRPDMLIWELERFRKLMEDQERPVQVIWAGKPYPQDEGAIKIFNDLFYLSHHFSNMAVLTGYELSLSKSLKQGADIWLNTPVVTREASGTSGMTAAMNATLNLSTNDGWVREFAQDQVNSFLLPIATTEDINKTDADNLYRSLLHQVLPTYYEHPELWMKMVLRSMDDVATAFDSDRMAAEYYQRLY